MTPHTSPTAGPAEPARASSSRASQRRDTARPALGWPLWVWLWRRRTAWGGFALPIAICAASIAFVAAGYEATGQFNVWRGESVWAPRTGLDDLIPAIPETIVLYALMYAFYGCVAFAAPRTDRGRYELLVVAEALLWLCVVTFSCFVLFPAELTLRAEMMAIVEERGGWLEGAYGLLFPVAPAWNTAPSMHVSVALLFTLATNRWWKRLGARTRSWRFAIWALWVAVVISTFTTKQHYVVDAVTGSAMGWAAWRWAGRTRLARPERVARAPESSRLPIRTLEPATRVPEPFDVPRRERSRR